MVAVVIGGAAAGTWSPLSVVGYHSCGGSGASCGGGSVAKGELRTVGAGTFWNWKERRLHGSGSARRRSRCRCSSASEWDWNAWNRHFSEIDQTESYSSLLKFQLEDAIEKEDFQEAAKLKKAIAEAQSKDTVSEIMSQLKKAVDEERYHDAAKISNLTGSGLLGWWFGLSKDPDDPFGRIVQITPALGRFLARSYNPRQLLSGSPGRPLFEIFVIKDAEQRYIKQVVVLQQACKGNMASSVVPTPKALDGASVSDSQKLPKEDTLLNEYGAEKSEEKKVNTVDITEEALSNVIEFLKDRIPDLKVKVMKVSVPDEVKDDGNFLEQLMEDDVETTIEAEISEDETENLDDIQNESVSDGSDTDAEEDGEDINVKLVIGGVLQNQKEESGSKAPVRVPANIENMEKDSFLLNISGNTTDNGVTAPPKLKVAAVAAQAASDLMPVDVAKALWGGGKAPLKVSKGLKEIVKLAVAQAQKWNKLPSSTIFQRLVPSSDSLDPFDGLYIGAFGPYGSEVVQLKRKYGHWHSTGELENGSSVEFFEYVEAVKLTGDLNVPAGQVTFRAKIGKGNRLPNQGNYPEEIGVVARYRGQGRIAEPGFKNPQWVDGELLLLSGKGMGHLRGAKLGFLYVVPEQSFLVLFDQLKLPE
ncbi:protein EXECUTER 2, chloroplastic [Nymphaea colorata]|nr:protein EXECUTER 2, chloroplastic [Nymphaea colorata]